MDIEKDYIDVLEYVDVRGIWPIYIKGQVAIELVGKRRDISLADARIVAAATQK